MDVTLGVAVEGTQAQIALLDAVPPHTVIDQSQIDLTNEPVDTLAATVVSTDRTLAESGHRLVGTSVCSSDPDLATRLHDALVDAELTGVTAVSQSDAVTAVTRSLVGGETAASLMSDGSTAALSIVDSSADTTSLIAVEPVTDGDQGAAYRTLLERFSEEPGGATSVIVLGAPLDDAMTAELNTTSPVPLRFPENPAFALARGTALAGFARPRVDPAVDQYSADSLNSADTMLGAQAQQLAYSQVEDADDFGLAGAAVPMQTPMQPLSAVDPDEYETEEEDAATNRPRTLLLGSTVAAVVVVGFAALAVSVAINIRPTATEQPMRLAEETIGGKYFPVAPGQGVNPDGPNWTMIEDLPQPGTEPEARVFRTQSLSSARGTGDAGAEIIKFFRDGTIGVVPNGDALTPPVLPGGSPPVGVPQASEYLMRLIPDFSRWSPCQVLALMGNLSTMGQSAIGGLSTGVTTGIDSLSQAGTTVLVKGTQGALFNTTKEAADTTTDVDAIPEIFSTNTSERLVSDELPMGTKIVDTEAHESLPTTGDAGNTTSLPKFGDPIPEDVVKALPGAEGTAPVVKPDSKTPSSAPSSDAELTDSNPENPGVLPEDPILDESTPPEGIPDTAPPLDGPTPKNETPPLKPGMPPVLPDGHEPKVDQPPIPKPPAPVEIPKPPAPVEIAEPQVPVEIPEPPPVQAPAPPVIEVPAPPPVQAPAPPAPVIEVPAPPPVQAPAPPVIDVPKVVAPEPESPAEPEAPSAPVTTLPASPSFDDEIFGSGNG